MVRRITSLFIEIFIFQNLETLTQEEERQVRDVLTDLSEQVQKRRLMVYQYFKDYDRVHTLLNLDYNKLIYVEIGTNIISCYA